MWLTLIPLILSIVSQLPTLIKEAEAAFGGQSGSGALKKAFVTDAATAALGVYQSVAPHPLPADHAASILSTVSSLTDSTVQAFNTAGLFMNAPKPQPPTA
jgi:hypothetical protein